MKAHESQVHRNFEQAKKFEASSSGAPKECSVAARPEIFGTMMEISDVAPGPSILHWISIEKVLFLRKIFFQISKIFEKSIFAKSM